MEISYLSHGLLESGGYRHELFFAGELKKKFSDSHLTVLRKWQNFSGLGHIQLQWWGFKNSNAGINIVVVRLALIALLRNLFSQNKIFIVLHNYDSSDRKGVGLKLYYSILFLVLRTFKLKHIKVVAVSPFFKDYFKKKMSRKIILFPNLFDTDYLAGFKNGNKKRRIHLGQWSDKNSPELFRLAGLLKRDGYDCYFSTLNRSLENKSGNQEIKYFQDYENYLQYMAESCYTLAFPKINEGWNRVAHESVLVGTQVIGFEKGGLGELLKESGMLIVKDAEEAYDMICKNEMAPVDPGFISKYDIRNAGMFLSQGVIDEQL